MNHNKAIIVKCNSDKIVINEVEISFPIHLNELIALFGEPSQRVHDLLWRVVWDDLGIYTEYGSWNNVLDIKFLFANNHASKYTPSSFFKGEIYVNKQRLAFEAFEVIDLIKHQVRANTYKGQDSPYSISVGWNHKYEEAIPADKYSIKPLQEEVIDFVDFGFKVSVIQELMYNQEVLTPKFNLREFAKWYKDRKIDLEEEGYDPIPEVTQYFKDLPIPKRLAENVTEIIQDGGDEIYLQLIRFAEGYEDYWDIESLADIKHFPNLKKVILAYAKPHIEDEFEKRGIQTEWV